MVEYDVKAIHIVECPHTRGEHDAHPGPLSGDTVEIECVGGYVKQVDPKTRTTTEENKRFKIADNGSTLTMQPPALDKCEPKCALAYQPPPRWNPPVARKRR